MRNAEGEDGAMKRRWVLSLAVGRIGAVPAASVGCVTITEHSGRTRQAADGPILKQDKEVLVEVPVRLMVRQDTPDGNDSMKSKHIVAPDWVKWPDPKAGRVEFCN